MENGTDTTLKRKFIKYLKQTENETPKNLMWSETKTEIKKV
jgi:hypothetical protein